MDIMGRPFDDGLLIRTAYAFEQATRMRKAPQSTPALKY
jgi:amidase